MVAPVPAPTSNMFSLGNLCAICDTNRAKPATGRPRAYRVLLVESSKKAVLIHVLKHRSARANNGNQIVTNNFDELDVLPSFIRGQKSGR